jgi:hypothetical protein
MPTSFLQGTQECRQAEDFFQEPSCRRLADFVQPRASLSRTTRDKPAYCCMPMIDGKKIFSRTLKCHSRWSWACDPEDSKSKPMVQARERQANGEPSLVVDRGNVSWTMLSLIALTRQAACQVRARSKPTSVPTLGMSLPRLPFL